MNIASSSHERIFLPCPRSARALTKPAAKASDSVDPATSDELLLGVLVAIDRDANTSQRSISRELNVALGLANAYFKRCVRKGLVKISQAPRRRYIYYLTPKGFAEKARLTTQYLSSSFNFFRRAREEISHLMSECSAQGRRRIVLAGVSDLAEVALLCAHHHPGIELQGVIDAGAPIQEFHGLPVRAALSEFRHADAVILTSLADAAAIYQSLNGQIDGARILVPRLLRAALPGNVRRPTARKAVK